MEELEELFIIFTGKLENKTIRKLFSIKLWNILTFILNFRADDCLKEGTLIGEDKYGNKYYQNNRYFYGKNKQFHFVKFDTNSSPYFLTFQEKIVGWSTIQMSVLNTMVVWFQRNGLVGCTTKQIFHQQRYENDIFWYIFEFLKYIFLIYIFTEKTNPI